MSHTFTVTIKDFHDYEGLIKLQEEIVNFRFSNPKQDYTHNITGKYCVEGLGFSVNHYANATLRIWREEQESLITVPLEYTYHEYTTLDDPREQIEVVYGIGDPNPVYITPAMRKRYRDLEGYRAYRDSLTECAYAFEREYEDEFGTFTHCGHGPESHGPDGCKEVLYWDGAGYDSWPVYCPCECYTKPAPLLMRI